MSGLVLANIYTQEGNCNTTVSITFPWRPRKTVITNDSSLSDLTVTIKGYNLTLKPTETLTATLAMSSLTLTSGSSIPYRVWAFG